MKVDTTSTDARPSASPPTQEIRWRHWPNSAMKLL